jgi:hypothetical protein
MPGTFATITERIRRKGVVHIAKKALLDLLSHCYMKLRFYEISHDISGELPAIAIPGGYEARELEKHELPILEDLVGRRWLRIYGKRMDQGMHCSILLNNGEVVNFLWSTFLNNVDDILGLVIPVGAGEAYSFNTFTSPKHRHRGVFFSLLVHHMYALKARGIRRVLAVHIESDMVKVYARYKKAGIPTEIIRIIDYRKILFWKSQTWSPYDGHIERESCEAWKPWKRSAT